MRKFLVLFAIACIGTMVSCKKDKADPANLVYTGSFIITESCTVSGAASGYVLALTPDTDNDLAFTIGGLWEVPAAVTICDIDASDDHSFSAARQPLATSGFDIEIASATINNAHTIISGQYSVYNGATLVETCTFTASK